MGILHAVLNVVNEIPLEFFMIGGFIIGGIIGDIDARLMHKRIFKDNKND